MYSVVIADDEKLIREGMLTIIDWKAEGFRISGVAADGPECLDLLKDSPPDVCIIDIRMPGKTGLEVIEECRSLKNIHFIILSGYKDFEYAKKAINFSVENYLLKPVDEDELIETLSRIRNLKSGPAPADRHDYQVFRQLLGFAGGAERTAPDPGWESYQILLLDVPVGVSAALSGFVEKFRLGVFLQDRNYAVIVLRKNFLREPGILALNSLFAGFAAKYNISIDGVLSGEVKEAPELLPLYRKTLELMPSRFLSSRPGISAEFDFHSAIMDPAAKPDLAAQQLRLEQLIEIGNDSQIKKALNEFSAELLSADLSAAHIREWYSKLCIGTLESIISKHKLHQMSSFSHSELIFSVQRCRRINELEDMIAGVIFRIIDKQELFSGETLVKKMKFLISTHYQENLKIKDLSDMLNYNSAYLGKVFKAHEGVSFNTYLDQVRIEKAKEQLRQGYKVYQTAENVGYAYVDYFHTKFRKYVGMSPLEYRKKVLEED